MPDAVQPPPTRAVRLIFEYEGDAVRLLSQQPVDTVVTGFDTPPELRPGHFVEARDVEGRSLVRVPARGAFLESAEVFPEDPAEPITRVDVEPRGAFTVVVPAPEAATEIAVVRVAPPGPEAAPAPGGGATGPHPGAVEQTDLATFPLDAR